MPSSNPRYANWKLRERALSSVRRRAADGEPCALCGRPIDVSLNWWTDPADGKRKRHPWSCECDEIVPVSRGGSPYDLTNVQPAHRICNQRKGNGRNRASIASHVGNAADDY